MAEKKGFWKEFKAFIARGNVLDMAVGIIIGGAFTAIITAIVSGILTPLLQSIGVGSDGFGALQIVLKQATLDPETGAVVAEAIVLDFGVVISAIVTFILTAFILFLIVYTVNRLHDHADKQKAKYAPLEKEDIKALRKQGKSWDDMQKVAADKRAEAAANAPAPAPTTEQLLAQIRDLLQAQAENK